MLKNHATHIYYYVLLILALVIIAAYAFWDNSKLGYMYSGILASAFYVGWALVHHYFHHDLHLKVMVEYIIIGVLGISAVYFMLSIY